MAHDEQDPEFIARVQVQKFFFQQIGEEDAAKFTVHLLDSVDGLNANNRAFAEAYRELLAKEEPTNGPIPFWHVLHYGAGQMNNLPTPGRLLVIIIKTSSKIQEWLFASYEGDGQFKIETQAQLQDDGSRKKLVSRCHASFVTHWQYINLPVE